MRAHRLAHLSAVALCSVATTLLLGAQSLELRPAYITGTVTLGLEPISHLSVNATSQGQSASGSFTGSTYTLTVNVPAGTSPTYNVVPQVYTSNNSDYLRLPSQTVVVQEGQTSTLDVAVTPAFLTGTISVQGGTLNYAYIYADNSLPGQSQTWYAYNYQSASAGSVYRLPILPTAVRVWADVYLTNGARVSVPAQSIGTAQAGADLTFNVAVTAPASDGSVTGTLTTNGPRTPTSRAVQLSGPASRGGNIDATGAYAFTQLPAGSYNLYAYLYFNGGNTYYQTPFSGALTQSPTFTLAGNAVVRNLTVPQALLGGTLTLTGSRTLAHATDAGVYINGQAGTATQNGYAFDRATLPSGEYEIIASPGAWLTNSSQYVRFLSTTGPAPLDGHLNMRELPTPVLLLSESTPATYNPVYALGAVTVVLRSPGVTFSAPYVSLSCSEVVNGQQRTSSSGTFYGVNQNAVNVAPVTFTAPRGRCTVDAYGRVTGSTGHTLFGRITTDVVAGTDLTVDIGGPRVTVTAPAANAGLTANTVEVIGTATDDEAISAVTVNGVAATFSSTHNPSDPNEVGFSATLALVDGANPITVVATDNSGRTATDSRTVYLDAVDPAVSWAPSDGTIYTAPASVIVSGTATDNLGVRSIAVNGATVFASSGPGQTTVAFTRTLTLAAGTHALTVTVIDVANRTISETRTVTVQAKPTTTVVSTTPNPSRPGETVTASAHVAATDGSGPPTGSVTFSVDGTPVASAALAGGVATASLGALAVGNRTVVASYTGSLVYDVSNGSRAHTVEPIATQTSLSSSLNPSPRGASVTFTATVSAGSGTPNGTVQFLQAGLSLGAPLTLTGGSASIALADLPVGSHVIDAAYSGSSTHASSSGTVTQVVRKAEATILLTGLAHVYDGTARAAVVSTQPSGLTGLQVTYDGQATPPVAAGTYQVRATLSHDEYEAPAVEGALTIQRAVPTIAVTAGTVPFDGATHGATASVSGVGGEPLGPVVITYDGGAVPPVDAGAYAVAASFAGDANHTPVSAGGSLVITPVMPVVQIGGGVHVFDGLPHPATGTVTGVAGVVLGSPVFTYTPGGQAVPQAPGIYSAVGSYAGSRNYLAATSAAATLVINAPPVITSFTGTATPVALGTSASVAAQFSDAATGDTHGCTFTWAEGASTTVGATAGACSSSHQYGAAGVYTVELEVVDDDGLRGSATLQYIVVYDPSAGFVTGGGWIDSPVGAYTAGPNLAGRATFGFVSRYKKGMTVPTGETEFNFQVGDLRFRSTAYDWLVVSGAKAQYKGAGTINAGGQYGFLLTALDGQVKGGGGQDAFRIKIWDIASGLVVYDNQPGSADDLTSSIQGLGGGSIIVHGK